MLRLLTAIQLAFIIAIAPALQAVDFRVEGKSFMLDGKKFQIRSGEIHYSRVPRAEWGNRIALAKAMGLNTICTYVFWGYHETSRGEFDFTGEKDFIAFVRECERQGMKAMVRPGPYVCAEWDLGGLPAWLLAEPGIQMRTVDPRFMEPASAWMARMGRMLQPHLPSSSINYVNSGWQSGYRLGRVSANGVRKVSKPPLRTMILRR